MQDQRGELQEQQEGGVWSGGRRTRMYGPHHRVASLRPSGAMADRQPVAVVSSCDTLGVTPMGTQAETLMQRGQHLRCSANSGSLSTGAYALPAAMQRTCLTAPSVAQALQNSQQTMTTAPLTQVQVGDGPSLHAAISQTVQHQKEATAALLTVAESLRQREKLLAASCQGLSHLSAIVDGQNAQTSALHGLVAEVRAMVEAIRDVATALRAKRPLDGEPDAADLVLGGNSPFMTPRPTKNCNHGNNAENENNTSDDGAAYVCSSSLMRYVALGALNGVTRCAAKSQFVEDDVFSM